MIHHDRRPKTHPVPEVNLVLLAHTRPAPPPAEVLPVPATPPPPPLERNERIRLFAGAPASVAAMAEKSAPETDTIAPTP